MALRQLAISRIEFELHSVARIIPFLVSCHNSTYAAFLIF